VDGLLGVILGEAINSNALAIVIATGRYCPKDYIFSSEVIENTYDLTFPR
jgi:hypothetical protein